MRATVSLLRRAFRSPYNRLHLFATSVSFDALLELEESGTHCFDISRESPVVIVRQRRRPLADRVLAPRAEYDTATHALAAGLSEKLWRTREHPAFGILVGPSPRIFVMQLEEEKGDSVWRGYSGGLVRFLKETLLASKHTERVVR